MREVVMPILCPLLMSYGVIMLGWGGVGKTPLFIIMSMAMGRYHVRRLELDSPAGWRRAKSMDSFRHRAGNIQEGIFFDDPNRDTLHIEDLKSLMTVEEESTCEARYNDVKLAANSTRGCASNDLNAEDEPPADDRSVITSGEFFKLVSKFFCGERHANVLAVLKKVDYHDLRTARLLPQIAIEGPRRRRSPPYRLRRALGRSLGGPQNILWGIQIRRSQSEAPRLRGRRGEGAEHDLGGRGQVREPRC